MSQTPPPIIHQDRAALAAGYSRTHRAVELFAITAAFSLAGWCGWRIAEVAPDRPFVVVAGLLTAWLAADFGSGLVHWAGDTWGTTRTPLVGQSIIRTFREHHVDEKSITRHDFVETNGLNCLATLPMLLTSAALGLEELWSLLVATFLHSLAIWVFLTNQIHSWAHDDHAPAPVRFLQRVGLVLGPQHHAVHHAAPFDKYYCITTGWMNPVLLRLDFYRRTERLITALTGAVPRQDDIGDEVARALIE